MVTSDYSKNHVTYILGPPGTGKTHYLTRQVARAVDKYGHRGVLVTSYTVAAATELASRNPSIDRSQLGTLHAICFRELGGPRDVEIAEVHMDEWNRRYAQFRLSPDRARYRPRNNQTVGNDDSDDDVAPPPDEFSQIETLGDELYGRSQILRAQMAPRENWPLHVLAFDDAWTKWKSAAGYLDFTDLLEIALKEMPTAPGNPNVIIADEAQDLSRLQIAVIRQWAQNGADHLLFAADDDQCILRHTGASPEALFANAGTEYFREVLSKSHRVPRQVHALAEAWIHQLSHRQPKEYGPRPEEGEVRLCHRGNYLNPEGILVDAERYLAQGKTVMFLAFCAYFLDPLIRVLRQRGIPYHNSYRRKNLHWNPLTRQERTHRPVDRILGYLTPRSEVAGQPWRPSDLRAWFHWLPGELLTDAGKEFLRRPKQNYFAQPAELLTPGTLAGLNHAMQSEWPQCLNWFVDHLRPERRTTGRYLAEIARRHGNAGLIREPQIIVGTVHSVKGGEADVVFLFPDLSAAGMQQWAGSIQDRDDVIRVCYVGITRARESLIVCEPAKPNYIPLDACLARLP